MKQPFMFQEQTLFTENKMTKRKIMVFLLAILLFANGFLIGNLFNQTTSVNLSLEKPFSDTVIVSSRSTSAPSDAINVSDIEVNDKQIVFNVPGARISSYADSGSMLPILNQNANGIEIVPQNESQIHIGDIITYQDNEGNLIVHRVVKISEDNQGTYFVTKGDNAAANDGKIRFSQIKYLTIAIIY